MMNKAKIQQMINTAPKQWLDMFQHHGLGKKPTVDKLIDVVLDYTPTMRSSGAEGKAKYVPPKKVRKEAWKGLVLAHKHNWSSVSGIGLVRAMQLVVEPKIWERSVLRMKAYFSRHTIDKQGKNFGNDAKPSRGYIAWLAWGGDSGKAWSDKIVKEDNLSKSKLKNPKIHTRQQNGITIETYYIGLPSKGFFQNSNIEIMLNSPYLYPPKRYHSISNFFVPKEKRGKGDAKKLLAQVLSKYGNHPISAQVSSAPSLVLFYRNGFKVTEKPSASLEEALQMLEESGYSLNMRNILMSELKKNPKTRRNRQDFTFSTWEHPGRESSKVQTIMFSRKHFDGNTARAWLRKHNFKAPKMDKTVNYLRYRQQEPEIFYQKSFRTITFSKDKGIKAVVGIPKGIPKRRNGSKNIVLVDGRNMGSLDKYLSKYADDFTPKEIAEIRQGWSSFDKDKSFRKYYSFDGHKYSYNSINFSGREYAQVFQEVLYIDPKRIGHASFNEYGDENWKWFFNATDKQKVAWAKKQWKQKGKNPIKVSVDKGNFGVYMTDGHHRKMAAEVLGLNVPVVIETTSLPYEEAKRIIVENIPRRYNPRRQNGSTRLVPKEQVRMVGFCPKKTKIVQPEIKHALALIEKIEQRKILFPTPIRPMTKEEFMDGRSVVDNGHPNGAGHGQYDPNKQEVAINGNMESFDLIANIFHENLHHARPDWTEEQVRDLTGEAMLYLYGEYNLGKPYAEGRLEAKNFRKNPNKKIEGIVGIYDNKQVTYVAKIRNYFGWNPKNLFALDLDFYSGTERVGYVTVQMEEEDESQFCQKLRNKLVKRYPELENQLVADVQTIEIEDVKWRNLGIGKMLYKISMQMIYNEIKKPFFLQNNICSYGSTSSKALRTWKSLVKEFPHEKNEKTKTYVIAVLEQHFFVKNRSAMAKKETRDSKGRLIPQKYLTGYKGKQLQERIEELEQRRDEYEDALEKYGNEDKFTKSIIKKLYRPFKTDKGIKSRRSKYTIEAEKRGFVGSIAEKSKAASKYYGGKVDASILKEVNRRGMAAWASGGHRAGQTPHSWGIARVNSFLVGGKTFFTSDKDQAKKMPNHVRKAIEQERTYIV